MASKSFAWGRWGGGVFLIFFILCIRQYGAVECELGVRWEIVERVDGGIRFSGGREGGLGNGAMD